MSGVYIKFEIYILPPPPFLICIFSQNEMSNNEGVLAAGEKCSAFFVLFCKIIVKLGKKYAYFLLGEKICIFPHLSFFPHNMIFGHIFARPRGGGGGQTETPLIYVYVYMFVFLI